MNKHTGTGLWTIIHITIWHPIFVVKCKSGLTRAKTTYCGKKSAVGPVLHDIPDNHQNCTRDWRRGHITSRGWFDLSSIKSRSVSPYYRKWYITLKRGPCIHGGVHWWPCGLRRFNWLLAVSHHCRCDSAQWPPSLVTSGSLAARGEWPGH